MFRPEDISPIDVGDYLRREQRRFFRGGRYDQSEAAAQIALEAVLSGASKTLIHRRGDWIAILADIDWIRDIEEEVFRSLLPFHSAGPNGYMAEVIPAVFARTLITEIPGSRTLIKGEDTSPYDELAPEWARMVAFEGEST